MSEFRDAMDNFFTLDNPAVTVLGSIFAGVAISWALHASSLPPEIESPVAPTTTITCPAEATGKLLTGGFSKAADGTTLTINTFKQAGCTVPPGNARAP